MNARYHLSALLPIVLALAPRTGLAQASESETVFRTVSPGIAVIKDLEGFGSGIVWSPDGLILTCFHVVDVPLKLTVEIEATKDGARTKMTLDDVKLVSVHPAYDLAFVQAKVPSGVSLIAPPRIAPDRQIGTGEVCYIIGNPGGPRGTPLSNSIASGVIGAASRSVEDLSYIQISAPVNPGNSGGALCDKSGQVIGIVTFKMEQSEGLGFAIPIQGLKAEEFIAPRERKGDPEKAAEYEKAGNYFLGLSRGLEGKDREEVLSLAYQYFRLCLSANPNNAGSYYNVGLAYFNLQKPDSARSFFERAVEIDPDAALGHNLLGLIAMGRKDADLAAKHWLGGMQSKKTDLANSIGRGYCASNYAATMLDRERIPEAAYTARWAVAVMSSIPDQSPAYRQRFEILGSAGKTFSKSVEGLTDAQFTEIAKKEEGFSIDDMARFVSLKDAGPTTPETLGGGTEPGTDGALPVSLASIAKLAKEVLEGAPEPDPARGLRKKLPEAPADVRPARGGAYLLMHFKGMKKIGAFNIPHAKFETYIPLAEEDALYTAGGTVLLVFLPRSRTFETWDLRSFERRRVRQARILGEITNIEMPLGNPGFALVDFADDKSDLASRHYRLLNLRDFTTTEVEFDRSASYRDNLHLRFDELGGWLTRWATSHSPQGFTCAKIVDGALRDIAYEHSTFGPLIPSRGGERVYGMGGPGAPATILDKKGKPRETFPDALVCPVLGSDRYLLIQGRQVTVKDATKEGEGRKFELDFALKTQPFSKDKFTDDRKVFANAYLNRVCFIDVDGPSATVHALGLEGAFPDAGEIGGGPPGAAPGSRWEQKMGIPAGTRVVIEDGPAGVAYDPVTDILSWQIPPTQKTGKVLILLNLRTAGEEETYQRIEVSVR